MGATEGMHKFTEAVLGCVSPSDPTVRVRVTSGEVLSARGWVPLLPAENWPEPRELGCHSVVDLGNSKRKVGCYQWIYLSEMRTKKKPWFGHQDEVKSIHLSQQYVAAA